MSEVIAKAIDALNDGETNHFVDTINKELLDLSEAHHERYFKKAN